MVFQVEPTPKKIKREENNPTRKNVIHIPNNTLNPINEKIEREAAGASTSIVRSNMPISAKVKDMMKAAVEISNIIKAVFVRESSPVIAL